jgi:hypothetical protein
MAATAMQKNKTYTNFRTGFTSYLRAFAALRPLPDFAAGFFPALPDLLVLAALLVLTD